jgi:predicted esterase
MCEFMHNGMKNQPTVPEMVAAAAKQWNASADGIKYIFPCAAAVAPGRPVGHLWYNYIYGPKYHALTNKQYLAVSDDDEVNTKQFQGAQDYIKQIVDQEVSSLNGDASKVIIGGNSQGGCVAIHFALNYKPTLGALLCLRTCPVRQTLGPLPAVPLAGTSDGSALRDGTTMPIFCYIDGKDDVFIPPLQQHNYSLIADKGYLMTTMVDPKAWHETPDPAENMWAATWIAQSFFGWPVGLPGPSKSIKSSTAAVTTDVAAVTTDDVAEGKEAGASCSGCSLM